MLLLTPPAPSFATASSFIYSIFFASKNYFQVVENSKYRSVNTPKKENFQHLVVVENMEVLIAKPHCLCK
jgi:hypothetical protein